MKPNAIVLTNGMLGQSEAKTAHGLIRGSDRFNIVGIIDPIYSREKLSNIIKGDVIDLPIYSTLRDAVEQVNGKIEYLIIGVAPKGGKLPSDMKLVLRECLGNNISIISGLHEFISDMPEFACLAKEKGLTIIDVRKPVDRKHLHFWKGEVYGVRCPIIVVLGMDTNMGKRTTTRILRDACRKEGIKAEMVFTGQTGWLQDGEYGFVLDSTVNDFVSGELEYWICRCYQERQPQVIFLEGQASLRNPSGPCGAEFLVSGNAKQVVLVFSPKKEYFSNNPAWPKIPEVEEEINLIQMYGSKVIALAVNTKECSQKEAEFWQSHYAKKTGLPVLLPLEKGVSDLIPVLKTLIKKMAQV